MSNIVVTLHLRLVILSDCIGYNKVDELTKIHTFSAPNLPMVVLCTRIVNQYMSYLSRDNVLLQQVLFLQAQPLSYLYPSS